MECTTCMNILVDGRPLQDERSGGVRRLVEGLLPALQSSAPDIVWTIATTGSKKIPASTIHIPLPNKIVSALFISGLSSFDRHVENSKPDKALFFNLGFTGPLDIPYALIVHDLSFLIEPEWFSPRSRLWHKLVAPKRMIKRAGHLFAVSESTKRDLVTLLGIRPEKISVIPLGVDPLPEPKAPKNPPSGPFVLAIGQGDPRKNTATAIEAARQNQVQIVIAGKSGPEKTTDAELAWLYSHASCFLYPSWYEGYGIPLHEAASYGTPIIASTADPLPLTAPKGTCFAAPEKPHHWAEALREILRDSKGFRTSTEPKTWGKAAETIISKLR